jgi:hypothetical protein
MWIVVAAAGLEAVSSGHVTTTKETMGRVRLKDWSAIALTSRIARAGVVDSDWSLG